ncbi:helix-turn-helix transcriptional regulator [Novosphingobium naphthalenivorans]|uniref:helix-turn-helix transcriptional regulator n=1 Tax=Novosphingobium naphthalenivorans TaxID=273168 RepID=UPI0008297DFC|nr:helix-turn-helix transcriptional regulator [Novosphingobium naphthalenivorans]
MGVQAASSRSDRLIVESLEFLRQFFSVRGAMFYWIEPDLDTVNGPMLGMPPGLTMHYRAEMRCHDPLLASRLVLKGMAIADLTQEAGKVSADSRRQYMAFLETYRVTGNLDFVFWTGETNHRRAFAGASLLRMDSDPSFTGDSARLEALHRYVAFNLEGHERVRHERQFAILRDRIGLTARECSICELVAAGATNRDIADCLGLTLATVKTYMRSVFDKTGVETRTALAARIATLA